jgi:hypothetical protein
MKGAWAAALVAAFCLYLPAAPKEGRWLVGILLAVLACAVWRKVRLGWPEITGGVALIWAALTLAWSPDPRWGALTLVNAAMFGVLFLAARFGSVDRRTLGIASGLGIVIAVGLGFYDRFTAGGFGNENWLAEFIVLAIPLCFYGPRWLACTATLAGIVSLGVGPSDTPLVALGSLGLVAAVFLSRHGWRGVALAGLVLLPPVAGLAFAGVTGGIAEGLAMRAEQFFNIAMVALDAPLFGNGLGSLPYAYPFHAGDHLTWWPERGVTVVVRGLYLLQAHNLPLEIWATLGLVGLGVVALFAASCLTRFNRRDWPAAVCLVIAAGDMLVAFPEQNPATMVLIALALGFVAQAVPSRSIVQSPWLPLAVAPLFILALWSGWQSLESRLAYTRAVVTYSADPVASLNHVWRAYRAHPWEREPRQQIPRSVMHVLTTQDGVQIDRKTIDRVLALGRGASPALPAFRWAEAELHHLTEGRKP